jgi:phage shock protein E
MKKNLLLFIILFSAVLSYAQQTQEKPVVDSVKISTKLIKKIKKGKVILVDVRTPEEYKSGHLQYAQNIDYKKGDFKTQVEKLDKNKPVYLYCRSGNRSEKSVEILKNLGFVNVYNIGGFENLKTAGLPAE